MPDPARYASLSPAMIRRAPVAAGPHRGDADPRDRVVAGSSWRDDLRLFAMTWAGGFVFFLVFLA